MSLPLDLLCIGATLLLLLRGYPVGLTLAGAATLFALLAEALAYPPWVESGGIAQMQAAFARVFGLMDATNEPLLAIPLFVLMGVIIEQTGQAERLLNRLSALLAGREGLAALSVGTVLAAATGIVGATVTMLAILALPKMRLAGYPDALSSGIVAAAGSLGQLIPPSIVLILLADALNTAWQSAQRDAGNWAPLPLSTPDLFAACLLPGLLLALLYAAYIIARTTGRRQRATTASRGADRLTLLAPLVLIALVLGSILFGLASPTEAAALGAVGAMILAATRRAQILALLGLLVSALALIFGKPLFLALPAALLLSAAIVASLWSLARSNSAKPPALAAILDKSLTLSAMIFMIVIGAQIFSLTLRGLGGAARIEGLLADLTAQPELALWLVLAVIFVLGFFLDVFEIVLIVVPLTAPALFSMGHDPLWTGAMIALVLQTSFLTPPFGVALFYLRGAAPSDLKTAALYRGVIPFVALQGLAIALLALMPPLATALPALLR
ncbi:MAG: TRAP transporter large permease subunit [Neomegalonema sp.]|nr:TRAP transporter large permease subunit [Neomegalonema sp.]